ncbi:MAG: glycoside hydrolase family 97 N-terminal domain-containing protein, partial [Dysgonamonadaceae bacterium]|nr:glycoside hydrolase family 97 N-terminal domain-containing protein [Dysgonamonadaceae bacterium]
MKKKITGMIFLLFLSYSLLSAQTLTSPNGKLQMTFSLSGDGSPVYTLSYKGKEVIKPSKLGLELMPEGVKRTFDDFSAEGQKPVQPDVQTNLYSGFQIAGTQTATFDETWQPVWGETKDIRNQYNEWAVTLNQPAT